MCNNHVKESSETQWKQLARILKSAKSKNVTNNQKRSEKVVNVEGNNIGYCRMTCMRHCKSILE